MKSIYYEAMEVKTQEEADAMFELLVMECMRARPCEREEAEKIQRTNLGYFSGYYSEATQAKVEKFYKTHHPIFGPLSDGMPTPEQAFRMGVAMGRKAKKKKLV